MKLSPAYLEWADTDLEELNVGSAGLVRRSLADEDDIDASLARALDHVKFARGARRQACGRLGGVGSGRRGEEGGGGVRLLRRWDLLQVDYVEERISID